MKRSRFFYLHREVNQGKVDALDALQVEYTAYLKVCVEAMLHTHRFSVTLSQRQVFFPPCPTLSSQIVKNIRDHAVSIVSGWAASRYTVRLKQYIKTLFKAGLVDEPMKIALFTVGKYGVNQAFHKVAQEAINLYWSLLLEPSIGGKPPGVSDRIGMRMSEMTAVLGTSKETQLTAWWLGFSHLESGKRRIQLPLNHNPYITKTDQVSKGILARKEALGRWRFEVVEKRDWLVPEVSENTFRVGVDVGLNVISSASTGRLFAPEAKTVFDRKYEKVCEVRANRQQQGLKNNSPRLQHIEDSLSGFMKTLTGTVANQLVQAYPQAIFVVEDLDLRGCKGQKRFAYRALQHALETKAPVIKINPAYTSQTCPDCGYVSRSNRSGTKFHCRSCGSVRHADVVGAINLLGRSEDKQIGCENHPSEVKALLRERYRRRRDSSSRMLVVAELEPSSRRLTVRHRKRARTASNLVVTSNDQL